MQHASPSSQRFKQLDSMRGLAALVVFTTHAIGGVISLPLLMKIDATPMSIFINGNAAVMFFFVLSGFVLSLPFIEGRRQLSLTAFYTRRIFRIYPAFIAAIIFSVVLKQYVFYPHATASAGLWFKQYWLWDLNAAHFKEIIRTLLLIAPGINARLIDPPMWSLAVEMIMAFFIPFFILIASRSNLAVNICVFLLLLYLSYSYNIHTNLYAGIFYLGVVLAKYRLAITGAISRLPITIKTLLILVALVLYNTGMQFLNMRDTPYYPIFVYYLPAIGSGLLIVLILASSRLSAFFERRAFVFFAAITYSFYLMHFPVLFTVSSDMVTWFKYGLYVAVPLAFCLNVAISYLMMRFIEQPFQALASAWVKKYRLLNTINLKP